MIAKKFIFSQPFNGMPQESDFRLEEEEVRKIQDGEFLCEAVFLSVDPYMRAYAAITPTGNVMSGAQVAKILTSKNLQFPVGNYVIGYFGWRTHTIVNPANDKIDIHHPYHIPPFLVPELRGHPISIYLGALGFTGNVAYFGFTETCKPVAGDTVVITAAAGAVGSHVGQISKLLGCHVVGITGSDEKGEWLKSIGFDEYINYKLQKRFNMTLKEKAPRGVDCFFDNVGGEISSSIMQQMNPFGRVAVCGSISAYNTSFQNIPKATMVQPFIGQNILTVTGINASLYKNKWIQGIKQNREWLENDKLKYRETVYDGFEKLPIALIGVLNGDNVGKAVVKV